MPQGTWRRSLEAKGYACYFMGHNKLTKLSGAGCLLAEYDHTMIGWSNVACVKTADVWYPVVDAWSRGGLCEARGSSE